MGPDMRRLWQPMEPLPCGFRLYGGTALALYLNHRESADFDFFTTEPDIDWDAVAALPWLAGAKLSRQGGNAQAWVANATRSIRVSFLHSISMVPLPTQPAHIASNGVAVASPLDLVRSKLEAVHNRRMANDYVDLAAIFRVWPRMAHQAFDLLPDWTRHELNIYLENPQAETSRDDLASIRRHAAYRRGHAPPTHGTELE